ncbi:MAG: glutamine--fructose-6-phosphate transaminase (isomerizing) [Clostridia bacterium]|nr:glutamine--fructose-6-phosphate transaminase (isomerizing) [Clostridia bacterium]
MCGIIGYTGKNNAVPYLMTGLRKLEYRGYDSSGIALQMANDIFVLKRQGKISELEKAVTPELFSFCGIGHTRWATHGEPSIRNAHPHLSRNSSFAIVHNGIIENSAVIKEQLSCEGYHFLSDTDTEVVCQLLEKNYKGNPLLCIAETLNALEGSYALAIIHKDYPKTIFCAKKDSPLLIGRSSEGNFVFSDCCASGVHCESIYCLEDYELAEITQSSLSFFDKECNPIEKTARTVAFNCSDSEKNGFCHYMLKEIYEQPSAYKNTVNAYYSGGDISFPLARFSSKLVCGLEHIYIVGCGSAYHAGVYGRYIIEELSGISTSAEIASEFRYGNVPLNENTLVIVISQSGETADSIAALELAKSKGAQTLCIVNVEGSTMAQKAHRLIYTKAGTEIAVATTKAYLCQIAVLSLLAVFLSDKKGILSAETKEKLIKEILSLDSAIEKELTSNECLCSLADRLKNAEHIYFIGRNTDYALSLEGSLKLKEISYIHCEAYPAGELKHGTISLIEKGTPVVAVCLRRDIFPKTLSGIKEVKARGAKITAITREEFRPLFGHEDNVITIKSDICDMFSPFAGVIALQLLSYHTAVKRGCEVDKPRNLAKSVTVE